MLILAHLFKIPDLPRNYVARNRLVNLFLRHRTVKVILVQAPAGYGKTMAVVEFVKRLNEPVVWYPLEKLEVKTSLYFVWNLAVAIQTIIPSFGQQIETLIKELFTTMQQDGNQGWLDNTVLPALVTELARLEGPLRIILDDYHSVDSQEVNRVFTYLAEYSPENVRFIVTSRLYPDWSKRATWEGKGILVGISGDVLTFAQQESQQLAKRFGVVLTKAQVEDVFRRTKGWPILLTFLYRTLQRKTVNKVAAVLDLLTQPSQVIYDYLASELLNREEETTRDFLCQTSILRLLDGEICNAVLEIENSREILTWLAGGPFLEPVEESRAFQFTHSHNVIREFLQKELHSRYDKDKVERLYIRLGKIYESRGEWEQALESYCRVQRYDAASELIRSQASYLVNTSQLDRLENWLYCIPKAWEEQVPSLLVYRGIVLANRREPAAEQFLLRARGLFEALEDVNNVAWVNIELGWAYWLVGKCHKAADVLQSVEDNQIIPLEYKAKLWHHLSMVMECLDHFDQALFYGEKAVELGRLIDSLEAKIALTRILRHMSSVYHNLGRHRESFRSLQEAYSIAKVFDLGNWSLAWIDLLIAIKYQHEGRFEQAFIRLDEADSLLKVYRDAGSKSNLLQFITITRGHFYRETYDYERAEILYHEAEQGSLKGKLRGVFLALRLVQPGCEAEALDLAQQEWEAQRDNESPVVRAMYTGMLGLAYLNLMDYEQAVKLLSRSESVLETYKSVYGLIAVRMYLTKVHFELDHLAKGKVCLEYVLRQMRESGYYHLDWWRPDVVAEMCAWAIEAQIEPEFAQRLTIRRLTAEHLRPFLRLTNDPRETVRLSARYIFQCLDDAVRLEVSRILDTCNDPQIKQRFIKWLDLGWLTESGLICLEQLLSWRQSEVFLLWVCPYSKGSPTEISQVTYISTYTVKDHLKAIKLAFEDKLEIVFSEKGAHIMAYNWAILNKVINPKSPDFCWVSPRSSS